MTVRNRIFAVILVIGLGLNLLPFSVSISETKIKIEDNTASAIDGLHHGASGLAHGIPDFCAMDAGAVMVPAGTTQIFSGTQTISCLGVHGTARISSGAKLTVETIFVYSDGYLEIGTSSSPATNVEIIFRNTPINTSIDPEQYSHGLIGLGRIRMHGEIKTNMVRLTAEVAAGASTLTLSATPTNWKVGDSLVLPDTRQLPASQIPIFPTNPVRASSQSETVTIASISGTSVTLSSPTQFSHLGARRPDGTLVFLPHAANLTRSVIFRSENPNGTRAHTLFSQRADVDIRYAEFRGMGRTTSEHLNSTTFNADGSVASVGTNQIGRYPVHFHHTFGPTSPQSNGYQYTLTGISVNGFKKWGVAVHNTHFGLLSDSVIYDGTGSGITTEDGSETANKFIGNFIAKVNYNTTSLGGDEHGATGDPHARKGNCFWFRAPNSEVRGNVCADTREGLDISTGTSEEFPNFGNFVVNVPNAPGVDTTVTANVSQITVGRRANLGVTDNEIYSTSEFGVGFWVAPWNQGTAASPPISNLRMWHNSGAAILMRYTDITIDGLTMINKNDEGTAFQQFNDGSPNGLGFSTTEIRNADIRGHKGVFLKIGQLAQAPAWRFKDSVTQTVDGFIIKNDGQMLTIPYDGILQNSKFYWDNVRFLTMPGKSLKTIQTVFSSFEQVEPHRAIQLIVTNYQGQPGNNFRVWWLAQAPNQPAPPTAPAIFPSLANPGGCPQNGLTNQQCMDQFGVSTLMEIPPCTDISTRPEITGITCPYTIESVAPIVSISSPTAGATVSGTTNIAANASDNTAVAKVEFYVDGVIKNTDTNAPYSYAWDTTNGGTHPCNGAHSHTLTAKAYDSANNSTTSSAVVVNMGNPTYCSGGNPPPTPTPTPTPTPPPTGTPTFTLTYLGKNRDVVSSSDNIVSDDQLDGVFAVTASQAVTATGFALTKQIGVWDTIPSNNIPALGVAMSGTGALINNANSSISNRTIPQGTFYVFAHDFGNMFTVGESVGVYIYTTTGDYVAGTTISSTPTPTPLAGDLNLDHIVNSIDFSLLNSKWFTSDSTADINKDGIVNSLDFSIMNGNWFKTW